MAITALVAGLVVAASATAPAAAATVASAYDARLLLLINQTRVRAGLPVVGLWTPLSSEAAAWSAHMSATGALDHDPQSFQEAEATCSVSMSEENVGFTTGSADSLFRAYMASPGHRANILSPSVQFLGLGTVSAPWAQQPTSSLYWNTMRFVGGTCPRASYLSSATPTTATLVPMSTPATPGKSFVVRAALVAPAGPARSATLSFTPASTGVERAITTITLTPGTTHRTWYRGAVTATQRESGTWRIRYAGTSLAGGVGDTASGRSVFVSARTTVGGFVTGTSVAGAGSTKRDWIWVAPGSGRPVYHQYKRCSTCVWRTYKTYAVPSTGGLTLTWKVASGTRYWRAYLPSARNGLATRTRTRTVLGR